MEINKIIEFIEEIEKGKSIDDIAFENMITPERVRAELLYRGGKSGKDILLKELCKNLPVSIDEIKEKYNEGKTTEEVAKDIGMPKRKLNDILVQYKSVSGEVIRPRSKPNNRINDLDEEKIIEEYRSGKPVLQISKEMGVSSTVIYNRINKYIENTGEDIETEHKIQLKNKREKSKIKKQLKCCKKSKDEKICEKDKEQEKEYKQRKLLEDIIREHGYSYEYICKIFEKKGYEKVSKLLYYQALNNVEKDQERE